MIEKHILGKNGEEQARKYFLDNGYTILEKNWRYIKAEIDLIVQNQEFIVFVEVKTRSTSDFGAPESFVTKSQQKLIINAAHNYIEKNDIDLEARFDILSVVKSENEFKLTHLEDAFSPTL